MSDNRKKAEKEMEKNNFHRMPEEFISATIIPNNGNLGLTLSTEIILSDCTIDELKMVLIATMAGKAAEELLIGHSEGHEGDIEAARPVAKQAFTNASSPVNFIAIIRFPTPFADSVLPFDLTNELTHEQLTLKRMMIDIGRFLLIRCPIERNESKWTKWEEEAIDWQFYDQWNRIDIRVS
ncbi:hypothetical protein niasHT_016645 [Heterodera trifolii]|uniref:Uncharacterized protein n=1 Tax=Heterodera trifolii TaxID=157864 RepID=A0ABD2L6C3_9BILA